MSESDIFEPYERLVEIRILGVPKLVPENNSILRCLQYLWMDQISYSDLCWNGDCMNCRVWLDQNGKEKAVLACRTTVTEHLEIVRLDPEITPDSIN